MACIGPEQALAMTIELMRIDASSYVRHPMHSTERTWTETNCYVDLWIELLHTLGLDPVAGAAFALSTDFEGDQWTFFKYPPEDLRYIYGIEVSEINVWKPVLDHVIEQLQLGRLLTVEADAWYLPDTYGVSYQLAHTKTTFVPQMVDPENKKLGYFHNAGYYELEGDDFDHGGGGGGGGWDASGGAASGAGGDFVQLPPYVESIKLDGIRRNPDDLVARAVKLAQDHVGRRPATNPMVRFEKRMRDDLPWLATQDMDMFHLYAFGTCRQCGSSAELAASFVDWLDANDGGGLAPVAEAFRAVADGAKGLQFALARVVRGRDLDLHEPFDKIGQAWETAMDGLERRYGV
jgi:hypothetical protein